MKDQSLSFATTATPRTHTNTNSPVKKIIHLENEITYLNRIIQVKDCALEGFSQIFNNQMALSKTGVPHYQNISNLVASLPLSKTDAKQIEHVYQEMRNQLDSLTFDYLAYYKIEAATWLNYHNRQLQILKNSFYCENTNLKDYSIAYEIEKPKKAAFRSLIYEIPVEIISAVETQDNSVQVNLFQTPVNSEEIVDEYQQIINDRYDILKASHKFSIKENPQINVQIYELPVQLNHNFSLPVELNVQNKGEQPQNNRILKLESRGEEILVDSQDGEAKLKIEQLQQEIELLNLQLNKLKYENEQLKMQIFNHDENDQQTINVVVQMGEDMVIELPRNLNGDLAAEYQIPIQITIESDSPQDLIVDYEKNKSRQSHQRQAKEQNQIQCEVDQLTLEIPFVQEPVKIAHETQTEISFGKISNQQEWPLQKQIIRQVPVQVIIQKQVQKIVEVPIEQIREIYIEKTVIREVPVEVFIEKYIQVSVPVIYQVPVEVVKQIIVEKEVFFPVVYEVPVQVTNELIIQKSVIREVPVQVIIQVPVIQLVPAEIITINEGQKNINQAEYVQARPVFEQASNELLASPRNIKEFIIREVPVQVIVTEEVIKIVQVPVLRQIPVEVVVEVQKTIIREVPVEVNIQIQKLVIRQVPVEVFVEVQKLVYVQQPIIRQVPIEVIVEIVVERQVFIQVQKKYEQADFAVQTESGDLQDIYVSASNNQVESNLQGGQNNANAWLQLQYDQLFQQLRIIEVPIELEIEPLRQQINQKIVQRFIEIPIQLIYQISVEKIVEVEVERVIQITTTNQTYIKQTIQREVEKEIYVPVVYQIPVEVEVQINQNNHNIESANIYLEGNAQDKQFQEISHIHFIEIPIECVVEVEQVVQRIVEVPRLIEVEKIVYVQKIVEVQVIKQIEKIVQIQKIVEVEKIVEIPIYQIVEKIVYIQNQSIREVPIEVYIDKNMSFPEKSIQLTADKLMEGQEQGMAISRIFQIPIQLEFENIIQINTEKEVIVERIIPYLIELPMNIEFEVTKIYQIPVEVVCQPYLAGELQPQQTISIPKEIFQQSYQIERNSLVMNQKHSQREHQITLSLVRGMEIQIYPNEQVLCSKPNQIEIHIPFENSNRSSREVIDHFDKQIQTGEQFFGFAKDIVSQISQIKQLQNKDKNQSVSEKEFKGTVRSILKVWQIPIQLQVEGNIQQIKRELQLKYKEKQAQLNLRYQNQIAELHNTIQYIQMVISQLNTQKDNLVQIIEDKALHEESLMNRIHQLQTQQELIQQENIKIIEQSKQQTETIIRQQKIISQLQQIIDDIHNNPVVHQYPVQIHLQVDNQDKSLQTDPLNFVQNLLVVQIPIQLTVIQQIDEQTLKKIEQQPYQSSLHESNPKNDDMAVALQALNRPEMVENGCQTIQMNSLRQISDFLAEKQKGDISSIPEDYVVDENSKQLAKSDMKRIMDELYDSNRFKSIDEGESYYNNNIISGIQCKTDYQNMIERNLNIYEIPVELIAQPIVYEVPVDINFINQVEEKGIQTQYQPEEYSLQPEIFQLPVELIIKIQTQQIQIQTETIHQNNKMPIIHKTLQQDQLQTSSNNPENRQSLLNQPQQNTTIQAFKKKISGFDYPQSSIQNITETRQMVILQNEPKQNKEMNQIQTPNLDPHDFNFSDYVNIKEKMVDLDQQRNNNQLVYDQTVKDLQNHKLLLQQRNQEIQDLKLIIDKQLDRYQQELNKASVELMVLQKVKREEENTIETLKLQISQQFEKNCKLEKYVESVTEDYEKLKDQYYKTEKNLLNDKQRLRGIVNDKNQEIRQIKREQYLVKQEFQSHISQLNEHITKKNQQIKQIEQELQKKDSKLQKLIESHEQMRKNMALMSKHQQIDHAEIYEQQFQRVKFAFQEKKRQLTDEIAILHQQIDQINKENKEHILEINNLNIYLKQTEEKLEQAQNDRSHLHHIKSQIQSNYITGVKQIEQMREIIREKDQIIQHFNIFNNTPNLNSGQFQRSSSERNERIKMEYLSSKPSINQGSDSTETYITNLQQLVAKYEQMLVSAQKNVKQYQDRVYQYLRDALEKQQQAEMLFIKLIDYENTMSNILVEKVALEIENKRICKAMQLSEKKITILGNRLIDAARRRVQGQGSSSDYS